MCVIRCIIVVKGAMVYELWCGSTDREQHNDRGRTVYVDLRNDDGKGSPHGFDSGI